MGLQVGPHCSSVSNVSVKRFGVAVGILCPRNNSGVWVRLGPTLYENFASVSGSRHTKFNDPAKTVFYKVFSRACVFSLSYAAG